MADLPTGKSSATGDEALAEELRNLKRNDLSIVNWGFLEEVVEHLLRDILDRDDWPEHTKLHARFCAFLIKDAVREARNAVSGNVVLNLIWAGLSLGMNSGLSADGVEMLYAEARSTMGSAGGRKGTPARRAKQLAWRAHATELALEVDPNLSNEKIANLISDGWKHEDPKCPGHKSLTDFISELRESKKLPQRTGLLRKRSG